MHVEMLRGSNYFQVLILVKPTVLKRTHDCRAQLRRQVRILSQRLLKRNERTIRRHHPRVSNVRDWYTDRGRSQTKSIKLRNSIEAVLNLHWFCHAEFRLDRISVILRRVSTEFSLVHGVASAGMRACCGPAWEAVSAPRLAGSLRGQGAVHDEAEGAGTPARSELFWVRVSRGGARGGGCKTRCRGGRTGGSLARGESGGVSQGAHFAPQLGDDVVPMQNAYGQFSAALTRIR